DAGPGGHGAGADPARHPQQRHDARVVHGHHEPGGLREGPRRPAVVTAPHGPAEEVADRLAIRETLAWYMRAMREKHLDGMDDGFTPGAFIDYSAIGGTPGHWPEVKQWLAGMVLHVEFFSLYVGDVFPVFAETSEREHDH